MLAIPIVIFFSCVIFLDLNYTELINLLIDFGVVLSFFAIMNKSTVSYFDSCFFHARRPEFL